ncbi:uncharacterized protein METZ01_LOCUS484216 [marine metagenome]|uniref:Uncharacterized protein n=1 Tax=marine metagenome TaxID=408172 RepID=A0A383CGM3_9ZZZZ
MENLIENSFFLIVQEFMESSKELADASQLCDDDPIKQEMISFIHPQFESMWARSEGIKVMISDGFVDNKDFILEEMKEITKQNYEMANTIRTKLGPLHLKQ